MVVPVDNHEDCGQLVQDEYRHLVNTKPPVTDDIQNKVGKLYAYLIVYIVD